MSKTSMYGERGRRGGRTDAFVLSPPLLVGRPEAVQLKGRSGRDDKGACA